MHVDPDHLAREAARLLASGDAPDEHEAVVRAARRLGVDAAAAAPSAGLVRRHLEGLEQQAQGSRAWRAGRRARFEAIEQLMAWLEEVAVGDPVLLAGRAAEGHLTGADPVRLRIYSDRPIGTIAEAVSEAGIEADGGEIRHETEFVRAGRRDAIHFDDPDAGPVVLVRLPPSDWADRRRNLYDLDPIPVLDLAGLRRRLEGAGHRGGGPFDGAFGGPPGDASDGRSSTSGPDGGPAG